MVKNKIQSSWKYLSGVIFTFRQVIKIAFSVQKTEVILLLVLSAIVGFSTFPTLYLEKLIIDTLVKFVGQADQAMVLKQLGLLVAATLVITLIVNFIQTYTRHLRRVTSRYVSAQIDLLVSQKVAELNLARLEDPNFADRFKKIERESGRRAWALMMPISSLPGSIVGLISSITILFLLNPLISLGVILFSLPQLFIDSRFIKKEYELDTRLASHDRQWGWLIYYLTRNRSFGELKILSISEYLTDKLKDIQKYVLQARTKMNRKRDFSRFWTELPLLIFEFTVSIFLIIWVLAQKITIGSFQFYLRTLRSAEGYLNELVTSVLELYENYLYVTDLVWLLNVKGESYKLENKENKTFQIPDSLTIEFKNVWFRYREKQSWILKDFNLTINPNEKLAVVGLNGSGKSTFIKLLCRFYKPDKGVILVNGKDISEFDLKTWRTNLSVLFQDFESYAFSVQESIGYGDVARIDDLDAIQQVAKKTGIHEFIESLPQKYKNSLTPEFEKGIRPSIGQAQRIGISRMLYRSSAAIMIMDEPTSSVDPEAEEQIFTEVSKMSENKILLFVTQRFSTVRIADRIIVIGKGQVLEQGTHEELMHKKGKYHELFELQAKGYRQ